MTASTFDWCKDASSSWFWCMGLRVHPTIAVEKRHLAFENCSLLSDEYFASDQTVLLQTILSLLTSQASCLPPPANAYLLSSSNNLL